MQSIPTKPMSILVSGSLAYDYIMDFPDSFKNHILPDQLHILNVCFMIDKLEKSWGGTAGNIAYNIKMLGGAPTIVGAAGKDAGEYLEHFKKLKIDTSYIKQDTKRLTASAYITTDNADNQIIAFYAGPSELAGEVALKNVANKPKLISISPTHKDIMIQHLNEAHQLGITTVFDPGQQTTAFSGEELQKMIGQADMVIGNDYEVKLLQERTGWSAQQMLKETKILITTLGERGSIISTREGEEIEVPACKPNSIDDPTGAGDAFRAGFFVGYEKGMDLKTCAQIGSVAASYAIESYGTQNHTFTLEEFGARYEKNYKEKLTW